jgi:preprotein translocase subunit SecD
MLYVDEEIQSSLNVGAVFKQQVITQPSINGGGETSAQARQDMKELQAILQSGRLPAPIQIDNISTISSSLGGQFMSAAIISIIASLIAVGGLIYLRYDDPRLVLPIVVTGASEVYILLGVFFSSFITLDLASIAGIIAAVGTGVDDQIIITDESGRDKIRDWSKRLKRAFFVIFTSAASTIGAMMPIVSPSVSNLAIGAAGIGLIGYDLYTRKTKPHHLLLGALAVSVSAVAFTMNPSSFALQSVRGFAITTILGVLVGITITRPAYAKFLEYLED